MSKHHSYAVRAERDEDGWWVVTVPELPGVLTQARRLAQVEELVCDAIALWLEVEPDSFDITVEPHLDADTDDLLRRARERRAEAERAQDEAGVLARDAAKALVEKGVTVRDAGQMLGVSHQRVDQLVSKHAKTTKPGRFAAKSSKTARTSKTAAARKKSTARRRG